MDCIESCHVISDEWSRTQCHESSEQWIDGPDQTITHIRRPRSNNQTQHPTRYKKIFLTHPLLLQIHTFYKNLPNPNPTHELSEIRRRFLFPQVRTFVSVSRIFETLGSWFFVISVKAENLVLWFCVWIWTTCSYWFFLVGASVVLLWFLFGTICCGVFSSQYSRFE